MNFCSSCGGKLLRTVPDGDRLVRDVCSVCGTIHYENPKMVVGVLPIYRPESGLEQVLLCRRDIQPCLGLWTVPAGYLEIGETAAAGAGRESYEETGARLHNLAPYRLYDIVHIGQLYYMFLGELRDANSFHPTEESSEVRLFGLDELPWDDIAFPVIRQLLHDYLEDREHGRYSFENGLITERMRRSCLEE